MRKLFITFIMALCCISIMAQRNAKYDAYIEKYSDFAVKCQNEFRIPASITLAQGILESAGGTSRLARECNNHFGIKCGGEWYGRSMKLDDDKKDECFRCYRSVKESYDDHAKFLQRQRYAFLFQYKITDYKAWARGLKEAGYATDPKYPSKLINLIETYELYKFDQMGEQDNGQTAKNLKKGDENLLQADKLFDYVVIYNNGRKCIKLLTNDTFDNISRVKGISVDRLLYYNDLPKKRPLYRGDYVYLAQKKAQTKKSMPVYVVKPGDSMHSISQMFGVRLKSLYKINDLEYGTTVESGQKIKLHK